MATTNPKQSRSMLAIAQEERKWNRLHDLMEYYHDIFRNLYNELYEMADLDTHKERGLSLNGYLRRAEELKKYLYTHHTLEERHLFPVLAKKMPCFQHEDAHLQSHHNIHEGLDQLGALIAKWKVDEKAYSPEEMRACLDSWRTVLFTHLDQEVKDLSGENMKKYWTLEEVEGLAM